MKVKEESEKVGLKLNIQKMKIMASGLITSWEIDGETVETLSDSPCSNLASSCIGCMTVESESVSRSIVSNSL